MTTESSFQPADVFPIDDLDALKVLTAEPRMEILELLRKPASVAQLADHMGVPRTRLYHHINALEELGAIVAVDERRAGAMTEKIYQVAATTYQPSERFLENATPKEQAIGIIDSLFSITKTDFVRAVAQERVDLKDDERHRRLALSRRAYTLTPERAAELVSRVEELLAEFDADEDTDGSMPFAVLFIGHPSSRSVS